MKINASTVLYIASYASCSSGSRAFSSRFPRRVFGSKSGNRMSSTDTLVENPFLEQENLPKFDSIEPKHLTPAVDDLLEKLESDFASLEKSFGDSPDYDDVLPKVERMQFGLGYTWGVAAHLNGVKNGDELREAYESNQSKVIKAMTQFSQSKALYDALLAIEKSWEGSTDDSFLMKQKKRAVVNSLLGMKLGGVGLEGEQKERFNEMKLRLASLSTSFSNNVLDETKAFSVTVDSLEKLEGVPDSAKALWANSYAQYMKSQAKEGDDVPAMNAEAGPWRITLDMPSYLPVLMHIPDRELRKQVYMAQLQRASDANPEKNNIPIIYEVLKIKKEMAKMLGFENYAELSLASKMAPSIQAVTDLTDLVAEKAIPAAKKELAEITALAREQGGDEYAEAKLEKLQPWDVTFWSERLKESKFDMTSEELRPYFALPAVLDGLFGLVDRIFDIEVKAADGDAEVWNPDVRFFKVFDKESGKHIASFFLDPFSRPENKRGGAWFSDCVGKSEATNRDIPVAYLTCNGSPPVGETPSLMTFGEVETLAHEFGHGLQHLLTRCSVGDVAGINGVEVSHIWNFSKIVAFFNYSLLTQSFLVFFQNTTVGRCRTSFAVHGELVLRPYHDLWLCQTLGDWRTPS
jgi:oligopeptidase A